MAEKRFTLQVVGNVRDCRTEAEIYFEGSENPWAVVYEEDSGWKSDVIGDQAPDNAPTEEAVVTAIKCLSHYPNRRGADAPEGLSAAGLSLWLMVKEDGTAMGMPVS